MNYPESVNKVIYFCYNKDNKVITFEGDVISGKIHCKLSYWCYRRS